MDIGGMHSYSDYVEFTQRYRLEHNLRGYDWQDFLGHSGRDKIEENELLGFKFPSDESIKEVPPSESNEQSELNEQSESNEQSNTQRDNLFYKLFEF